MTWKAIWIALGGGIGWLVGEFNPAFPLIIVAIVFILYDAWTAFQLDKRVKVMYPDKTQRHEACKCNTSDWNYNHTEMLKVQFLGK